MISTACAVTYTGIEIPTGPKLYVIPSQNDKLEAALNYHICGLNVMPLIAKSKIPPGGFEWTLLRNCPAKEYEIKEWFSKWKDANIGIIIGANFCVIDIDQPETLPPEILDALLSIQTPIVKTFKGFHIYCIVPDNFKANKTYFQTSFGELRVAGSYVVVPPSVHPDYPHPHYEFVDGKSFADFNYCFNKIPNKLIKFIKTSIDADTKKNVKDNSTKTHFNIKSDNPDFCRIEELNTNIDVVIRVLSVSGVQGEINPARHFLCPLHKEKHPSAKLFKEPGRPWVLMCYHTNRSYPIVDIYAACKLKIFDLTSAKRALFWIRAMVDIEEIQTPMIEAKNLPKETENAIKEVYDSFVRLIAFRSIYDPKRNSALFSWRFALTWVNSFGFKFKEWDVRRAIQWLEKHDFIRVTKAGGRFFSTEYELSPK